MAFKEDLQKLSIQINERKVHITNEEMTKQALIIPFLQVLGFDVFNPLEIRPEYVADFGKKKGEKVDYALFKDNLPIAFLEAKSIDENLSNHDAQLSRYFNAVPEVKIGILTNGIHYKFFTDLTADNIMDDDPFLVFDITNMSDSDIENVSKFKKESFDTDYLVKYAEELVYTSALNDTLKDLFKNPSDEFVRFLIKDFSNIRVTNNVLERFRPIVKKAISNAVLDIVSKGLFQQEAAVIEDDSKVTDTQNSSDELKNNTSSHEHQRREIITTKEELETFDMIKTILNDANKNIDNINYKDTVNYFSIFNKNSTKWFIRIQLDMANKNILTKLPIEKAQELAGDFKIEQAPKGIGESRIYIDSHLDIKKLDNLIISCFEDVE
ncbi:type I restriction endonuclease [Clostridium felsineum]|uniref:Restriction endonuclease type I HsdR N-terminal domain-containing protein n=1 Tax=Clostridium felsineum TaxID=36839 RepID=A0A1S8L389_9CLOT|nr:type I restriction endonuclease [Clostridium felsineum]URZ07568.1 hypothetical protein CLROS_029070 [Clostridium felsineum]URZ12599.1 hypothetical protein CROST_033220 [Clostridium felsineum]